MRNNYVTPAFRRPVRPNGRARGGMMRKWLLVCQKSERRLALRYVALYLR